MKVEMNKEETQYDLLHEFGYQMRQLELELSRLREKRDQLFFDFYNRRVMTVTEMATCAGIRRESVHDAINKQKKRAQREGLAELTRLAQETPGGYR